MKRNWNQYLRFTMLLDGNYLGMLVAKWLNQYLRFTMWNWNSLVRFTMYSGFMYYFWFYSLIILLFDLLDYFTYNFIIWVIILPFVNFTLSNWLTGLSDEKNLNTWAIVNFTLSNWLTRLSDEKKLNIWDIC